MAKIKTAEVKTEKKKVSFMEVLTGIWMVAILAVFPLFAIKKYANILEEKYGFMLIASGILLAGFIIWALIARRPKHYAAHMKSFADPQTGKWFTGWFKDAFNVWDIFMLAFFILVIISTLCASPYVYQAFYGNEGRWVGAISLALWCLTFFVASRYFVYKRWYLDVFMAASLLVCLWCITDFFNLDVMGFKYGIADTSLAIFTSSIGNIDTYAGVAAIPMAFSGIMFVIGGDSIWHKIFYWLCFMVSVTSMITCGADCAYLALAVFMAFMPIAALRTKAGTRRGIIAYATVFTAMALVGHWLDMYAGWFVQDYGALVNKLGRLEIVKWGAVILWIVAIALFIYEVLVKKYTEDTPTPKALDYTWIVLLVIGVIVLIVAVGIANTNPSALPASMDSFKHYLVLSDDWGTWRMYVWKKMLELYAGLPFIHKVVGTGPETASIYLHNKYYFDLAETTGLLFDSVHNEWLQIFFTMGPLGFIAYLGSFITPVVMASMRRLKKYYPVVLGVGFVCICHMGESFVNLITPMDMPIIFALMALAQSLFRSKE